MLAVCIATAAAQPAPEATLHQVEGQAMGTSVQLSVYASSAAAAEALFAEAFEEIEWVEQTLSTYRETSLASRLNAQAGRKAVTVDPAFFRFLARSLDYSRRTDGAFDVTVGRLVNAWGFFRGEGRYPDPEALAEARRQTGWWHVRLDERDRTVRFTQSELAVDFGGNGKGYALDRVQQRWRQRGVEAGLLVFGGSSIYAIGAPPEREGWTVEIPVVPGVPPQRVTLRDQALSTSGGAHKYFDLDGRRYVHILDPRTGEPVQGRVQVTVAAPTAEAADVFSTALFVLGPAEAEALLEPVPAAALFVEDTPEQAAVIRVRWCEGAACLPSLSDDTEF